mmetsp:Transcript_997/g.1267  ORF Transcript_997/g.1267 Transcript_997/m.1267 type:complete len:120 (-) Transcript_997:12-371(-)
MGVMKWVILSFPPKKFETKLSLPRTTTNGKANAPKLRNNNVEQQTAHTDRQLPQQQGRENIIMPTRIIKTGAINGSAPICCRVTGNLKGNATPNEELIIPACSVSRYSIIFSMHVSSAQ